VARTTKFRPITLIRTMTKLEGMPSYFWVDLSTNENVGGAKIAKRTRSKWARALGIATYKWPSEPLDKFMKRKGGINECAARLRRRMAKIGNGHLLVEVRLGGGSKVTDLKSCKIFARLMRGAPLTNGAIKMRLRMRKTQTENDLQTAEVVKYVKALFKATRANTNKKTCSNELPRTVEVTTEYLDALRRAVGQLIDPETAEVNWWHVQMADPYGDYAELPPHSQCTGRAHFARAPGTDVWIESADLPEATCKRLCEIHSSRARKTAAK
jgi:hypothetical protein